MTRKWMCTTVPNGESHVAVYRNRFQVQQSGTLNFRYSGDNHCQLYLDGEQLSWGPENGGTVHWYLQHVSVPVTAGEHTLTARVLSFGYPIIAWGYMTVRCGFWLEEEKGSAYLSQDWEWQNERCEYFNPQPNWGGFPGVHLQPDYNFDILRGQGGTWQPVCWFDDERELHEPDLPELRKEPLQEGRDYSIASEGRRTIVSIEEYAFYTADITFQGRGKIEFRYAECPFDNDTYIWYLLKGCKGNRDGKVFICNPESFTFTDDGPHTWRDFKYRSGRYLVFDTLEGDVHLAGLTLRRTGYPLQEVDISDAAPRLRRALQSALNTQQACSNDIYMDCPYYDQIMYSGDSYPEMASTFAIDPNCRLPEKELKLFALSQHSDGSIQARYPCREDLNGGIPSYSLYWLLSIYDHALWRRNADFTRTLLPAARRVVNYLRQGMQKDGLWHPGRWAFVDWALGWRVDNTTPSGEEKDTSAHLNLLAVLALKRLAEVERWCGDGREAEADQQFSDALYDSTRAAYFDETYQQFANDLAHHYYSEHPLVLDALCRPTTLASHALEYFKSLPVGPFFNYLYLEACYQCGLSRPFYRRLKLWLDIIDEGLRSIPEENGNIRSDCHAWGAHILFHYFASIKGHRPAGLHTDAWITKPLPVPPGPEFDCYRR